MSIKNTLISEQNKEIIGITLEYSGLNASFEEHQKDTNRERLGW